MRLLRLESGAALPACLRPDFPQGLLEDFGRLPALDQVAVVDDEGGNGVDSGVRPAALALAHFVGIRVRGEDLVRTRGVQVRFGGQPPQHLVVPGLSP